MRVGFISFVCAGLLLVGGAARAQSYSVGGTIVDDSTRQAISYVTVALLDDSTKAVFTAVVADENGRFRLQPKAPGTYTLHASYVGYTPIDQRVTVTAEAPDLQLGTLTLSAGILAEAVRVTAPLVTADIDKITYNPAADPETPSLTALEMMRKVPLLTVDGDENLELKGQRNYKILLNGKSSTLMANNPKEVLRSMPAGSIKSVEVITDPPSKYDAEGIGGIINIITHRRSTGFNGSVGINGDSRGGYGGNGYIAAALGKFNISANLHGGTYRGDEITYRGVQENRLSTDARFIESQGSMNYRGNYQGLGLEASYEIDTFNLISLSVSGFLGDTKMDQWTGNELFDVAHALNSAYESHTSNKQSYGSLSGNIDYQRTFLKPDKTFTASYKIDYSPDNDSFEQTITDILNYPGYSQRSKNKASGYEHTFQADWFDPLAEKHQVEAGVKYILRPNSSHPDVWRLPDGAPEWQLDLSQKNNLDYKQHIAAAYGGYLFKLKKFSVKLGVRAEYTLNDGVFSLAGGDHKLNNRYFDLIPYATLAWQPKAGQNLRLGYTNRLSRPGIWYLNPYVNDQNPYATYTGNPELKSEVAHAFNLTYGKYGQKFNINIGLSATLVNNSIEQVTTARPDGTTFSKYLNIGRNQSYNLSLYLQRRFLDNKLTLTLNASGRYSYLQTNDGSGLRNSGWQGSGTFMVNAQPWKNGHVNLHFYYSSPWISLQYDGASYWGHGLSVTQRLFDQKFSISVSASSPFQDKRTSNYQSYGPNFSTWSENVQPMRSFRLSLNYRFGKMNTQVKKARRGISNDDMKAGGSSGSAGGGAPAGGGQ